MDQSLKKFLDNTTIQYEIYEHPAVFTVEESKKIKIEIPGMHTKCLFMKDNNSQFYLIALPAGKRLNTNYFKKKFKLKHLEFASPSELKSILNVAPGSVSIFTIINDKLSSVFLIIDNELWDSELVGFHPNINTSTLVLTHKNLEKFLNLIKSKKEIIEL